MNVLSYLLIRSLLFPFSLLPSPLLHRLGMCLGKAFFPLLTKYRKRALSNLSLAKDLALSVEEVERIARESLGNLFITVLEYGKLSSLTNLSSLASCINPEEAKQIMEKGQGLIFFCAHQANWEIFFLEGTSRMKGVAIGQPIQNKYLYRWILQIRQRFGGKIIEPRQAVKEGLKTLKRGEFLGIVGDQGMPGTGFSSLFLGRPAWTSPLPALLAYRSGAPIIVATMTRTQGKYLIHYSAPLFANCQKSAEEEIPRLMQDMLHILEESLRKRPEEWLWQHNKWKQQGPGRIKKRYRQDSLAVILPQSLPELSPFLDHLSTFRELYPTEFLVFFIPKGVVPSWVELKNLSSEVEEYTSYEEIKKKDYRFKLIFNLTPDPSLSRHFQQLSALAILSLQDLGYPPAQSSSIDLSSKLKQVLLHAS